MRRRKHLFKDFSSFYEDASLFPDEQRYVNQVPYIGKTILFRSNFESSCSCEGTLSLDSAEAFFPIVDRISLKSKKPTKLQIFMPKSTKQFFEFKVKGQKINVDEKLSFDGDLKIEVHHIKPKGNYVGFIPIVYFLKNEDESMAVTVPIPVFVERYGRGWDLPLYHFLHPKCEEYLYPLLWKEYPEKYSYVFDITFPYDKKYVKHGNKYYATGIFYWMLKLSDGETHFYNFTAEPVTFNLFNEKGIETVEVLGDSREYRNLSKKEVFFVIAVGKDRVEWFPVHKD